MTNFKNKTAAHEVSPTSSPQALLMMADVLDELAKSDDDPSLIEQAVKLRKSAHPSSKLDLDVMTKGLELACFHLEAGSHSFLDFAYLMAEDLGTSVDKLRIYLRGWYNGARDAMEDCGLDVSRLDTPEQVRATFAMLTDRY